MIERDTYKVIDTLFHPESVAIVGASANPAKIGGSPIANMQRDGYKGKIYPINPNYDEIAGLTAYPSVLHVSESIDMAVIALSVERAKDAISECAQRVLR